MNSAVAPAPPPYGCQIVDTGLDETSCFFIDDSGEKIEHGYYFDNIELNGEESSATTAEVDFTGGYFPFDLTRRKVSALSTAGSVALSCRALPCLASPYVSLCNVIVFVCCVGLCTDLRCAVFCRCRVRWFY